MSEPAPAITRSGRLVWAGAALLIVVLLGLLVLGPWGHGPDSIHLGFQAEPFTTCGRQCHSAGPVERLSEIRARGIEPVLVDTAPLAPCPAGVHPTAIEMATVVYVRVAEDGYIAYELVGGP
jgi:hypothetical protein